MFSDAAYTAECLTAFQTLNFIWNKYTTVLNC